MADAPLISTITAIILIPIAILFTHAFFSGLKGGKYHYPFGTIAIITDLTFAIGYMVMRIFGLAESTVVIEGTVLTYFIIHGLISTVVIVLEFLVLGGGFMAWKKGKPPAFHAKVSKILFPLWWVSFITGEIGYVLLYMV